MELDITIPGAVLKDAISALLPTTKSLETIFQKLTAYDPYFKTRKKPVMEGLKVIASTKPELLSDINATKFLIYLWIANHRPQFYTALKFMKPHGDNSEVLRALSGWIPKR